MDVVLQLFPEITVRNTYTHTTKKRIYKLKLGVEKLKDILHRQLQNSLQGIPAHNSFKKKKKKDLLTFMNCL